MKPQTAEWVEKAEGDWNAARQLNRVRKDPNYDSVCFHCQQSVEKYLKARLEEAGVNFPKTHDLIKLLGLAITVEPSGSPCTHSLPPSIPTPSDIAIQD
jgi:HEPN domain-containing protein